MRLKQLACAVLALGIAAAVGGCLVMKGHEITESGVKVSAATLGQVKPGETTEAWVLATLGDPSSRRQVDEHTAILRYDHKTTKEKGGVVLFVFAGGESEEHSQSVFFEVKDGVVTRHWMES